jgi:hypothetical protein
MKSKLAILALLAVCLWGREVHADTVVDISATWCTSCRPGIGVPVDFQAQATVEPVTGTFYNIGFNFLFTASDVPEVTGISGTLNGSPISFLQAPQGDGSWLYSDFFIGALYFSVDGQPCYMFWDGAFPTLVMISDAGFGVDVPVNYSATVNTPEPATLGLFGMGFAALWWRLRSQAKGLNRSH